jgi:hypothetical protein
MIRVDATRSPKSLSQNLLPYWKAASASMDRLPAWAGNNPKQPSIAQPAPNQLWFGITGTADALTNSRL